MPKLLTESQINNYDNDGCIFPIQALNSDQTGKLRGKFDSLEEKIGAEAQSRFKIKAHLPFPWMHEVICHQTILDAIEDLIGPNILCWGSSFFTKKANDPRFVSWHQDSTYYGLRPPATATAWLAISDSTVEAGCMRFIPGTHHEGILKHTETWNKDNLLIRGQRIEGIDESQAADVILAAGEFSIHHEAVIHGSNPNRSDDARIGLSIHYIEPHVKQTAFEGASALLVRGQDNYGYWEVDPVPVCDFDPACLETLDYRYQQYKTGIGKIKETP
ncbi:MAG: phytanoyl-CoA dioxygenase family protein [Acidobacteriota bacterium]|nr:phytanoyl-CoA dioxygenase family protein [Acidobacteriota bacterium]